MVSRRVWTSSGARIRRSRDEFIEHADDPDVANPAKEQFDRYHRESVNVLSITLGALLLLVFLSGRPGVPLSRTAIMQHLWRTEHEGGGHSCEVHISALRRKIERDPQRPERIVTRRSRGYEFVPD